MHAADLKTGQTVKTRSGTPMTVVAYEPRAQPEQRLIVIDPEGEIHTYWDDGVFALDRWPTGLDLV